MPFFVYVLYSSKLEKYYVGSTNDIEDRLYRHNSGQSTFTKTGIPWVLIHTEETATRAEAVRLENVYKEAWSKTLFARYGSSRLAHPA
jgi:putative endonuclease